MRSSVLLLHRCVPIFLLRKQKNLQCVIGPALSADSLGLSAQLHVMPDVPRKGPLLRKSGEPGDLGERAALQEIESFGMVNQGAKSTLTALPCLIKLSFSK